MVAAVKFLLKEGTTIDVYFLDGKVKRYDVLSLTKLLPQYNALKDRKLFNQAYILAGGTIVWNDDLDIDLQWVYDEGIDVSNEYDDINIVLLGYKIKQKRESLNLSQYQLAKKIGIDQSDLSKIEKGNANPSMKMIIRIAKGLETNLKIDFK